MEAALQTALHGEQRIWRASGYLEMNAAAVVVVVVIFDAVFEGASLKETMKVIISRLRFQVPRLLKVSGYNKGFLD